MASIRLQSMLNLFFLFWASVGLFFQLAGLAFNNDGSKYATQLNLLLFLPALGLVLSSKPKLEFPKEMSTWLLILLFSWVLLYASIGYTDKDDLSGWFKNIFFICLYLSVLANIIVRQSLFVNVVSASVLVVSVFALLTLIYQFAVLKHSIDYDVARWRRIHELGWNGFADLTHPIYAGLYYGAFAVMLTWIFINYKLKFWQYCLIFCGLAGLLIYVIYTFSRGAWASTCVAGFILLLLSWRNNKAKGLLYVGLGGLVLGTYYFWPELVSEQNIGVNGRQLIWAHWFHQLPSFWLWGNGADAAFSFTFPSGLSRIPAGFTVNQAHSLYLQFWFEYGVVGVSLFLAMLLSLLYKGWICRDQPLARLGVSLLIFALVAMVSEVHSIIMRPNPYWVVVWFPIGIIIGLNRAKSTA